MKNHLLIFYLFLVGGFMCVAQPNPTNTITFDNQMYTNGQSLGSFNIPSVGKTFDFSTTTADFVYATTVSSSIGCYNPSSGWVSSFGPTTQLSFSTVDGSEINLSSFKFISDRYCIDNPDFKPTIKVEGFKDGLSTGSITIATYATVVPVSLAANSQFQGIDELRITRINGDADNNNLYLSGFDDIVWSEPCVNADVPTLTSTATTTPVCEGTPVTLNIAGDLNSAAAWYIYSGSCDGTFEGTTDLSSISVTPTAASTTYFIRAAGGCTVLGPCTASITINSIVEDATFTYSATEYCDNVSSQLPTITGTTGGTFSATPAGLDIDATTGSVDIANSTLGNYVITYLTSECSNSSTQNFNISTFDADDEFFYDEDAYCIDGTDPTPNIFGPSGGVFTSSTGLSINATTGVIDLSASTLGVYTVTYTFPGACANTYDQDVAITESTPLTFTAPADICIDGDIQELNSGAVVGATPVWILNDSFNSFSSIIFGNFNFDTTTSTYLDYNITVDTEAGGTNYTPSNSTLSASSTNSLLSLVLGNTTFDLTFNSPLTASGGPVNFTYSETGPGVSNSGSGDVSLGSAGQNYYSGPGVVEDFGPNGPTFSFDPARAGVGTHVIEYTYYVEGRCVSSVTDTIEVLDAPGGFGNAIPFTAPVAACINSAIQTNLGNSSTTGGVYSGPGVTDAGDGISYSFDPSIAGEGTHDITYTLSNANGCNNVTDQRVTITADNALFFYNSTFYNVNDADPTPSFSFVTVSGGTFTSTAGLVINSSTGQIDISASTVGSYPVTYTTPDVSGACSNSLTKIITIFEDNNDFANPIELDYGTNCLGSAFNIQNATLETGELVPDCAGNYLTGTPVIPTNQSSQWFSFIASNSGDALIKIVDNGVSSTGGGLVSASIALTLSLYDAPSVAGDLTSLDAAIQCSSAVRPPNFGGEVVDGAFIDASGLIPGNTYYVQVYSPYSNSINYCLDVSEPTIYTYDNGWDSNGNPEDIFNPYKRVQVLNGDVIQRDRNFRVTVGSLYVAQNASIQYNNPLKINYKMVIDGVLNPSTTDANSRSDLTINNYASNAVSGNGVANVTELNYDVNRINLTPIDVDLNLNVFTGLKLLNGNFLNATKKLTFKSTELITAYFTGFNNTTFSTIDNSQLTGEVEVENYFPEASGTSGRAFRFLSSPITSTSSIFSNWQENGASPAGFGTHITGSAGAAGTIDNSTGFDQTGSGANSLFTFSDNTVQNWDAVTSTNQVGDSLNIAKGYRLFIRGDRNVNLTNNTSSSVTVLRSKGDLLHKSITKTYDVEQDQFILTGNPYQNAVNISTLIDDSSNIEDDVVYYWDASLGGSAGRGAYVTFTGFDNNNTGVATPSSANNGYIQPGQAVFLKASAGANGISNNSIIRYKTSQLESFGIIINGTDGGPGGPSGPGGPGASRFSPNGMDLVRTTTSAPASISMSLYDTTSFTNNQSPSDGVLIRFGSNYSNAIGTGDHTKLMNVDESIAIDQLGNNYAVAGRAIPAHDEVIQLNHYNYGDTAYTYSIHIDGLSPVEVYIEDQFTNSITALVAGLNTFNFTVDSSNAASMAVNRFRLKFTNATLGMGDEIVNDQFTVFPNPVNGDVLNISMGDITGPTQVSLFNALGQQVMTKEFDVVSNNLITLDRLQKLSSGMYVLKVTNNNAAFTKKIILD